MSRYSLFVVKWKDCEACHLHETRRRTVIARGSVPCDVLFCGEAPGFSEDASGVPFVGPAGKLLDDIIKRAFLQFQVEGTEGAGYNSMTWAFCNLVMCIPLGPDRQKTDEPDDECIQACKPRLEEFVALCRPKLIVAVGRLAEDHLKQGYRYSVKLPTANDPHAAKRTLADVLNIVHPAAMLRYPMAQRDMAIQRTVLQLKNAVQKLGGN